MNLFTYNLYTLTKPTQKLIDCVTEHIQKQKKCTKHSEKMLDRLILTKENISEKKKIQIDLFATHNDYVLNFVGAPW